jgi:TPR repeat protein
MNNSYKQKYIKYKNKYQNLKFQLGGNTNTTEAKLMEKTDIMRAVELYKIAVKECDSEAQYRLGNILLQGRESIPQNIDLAINLFKQASKPGNSDAQYTLGKFYFEGNNVRQDHAKAAKLFKLSANSGNANAQYYLGFMYENGIGIKKNLNEMARLYLLSAKNNNRNAQHNLGKMYYNGLNVPQDDEIAKKLFTLAADSRLPNAQYYLGLMNELGHGGEKNISDAIKYYEDASLQGFMDATYNLANIYYNDDKYYNDALAMENFKKAAKGGIHEADYMLGEMHINGRGTATNYETAAEYYKKAAKQGNKKAIQKLDAMIKSGIIPSTFSVNT